jgi:hypothetical protein
MDRKNLIGRKGLLCYREAGRDVQCFGTIADIDESYVAIQTDENLLVIPNTAIEKIKIRSATTT